MEEPELWQRLEYRISAEFAGFADRRLRYYWCDGLVPEEYDLTGAKQKISGVAWAGKAGRSGGGSRSWPAKGPHPATASIGRPSCPANG